MTTVFIFGNFQVYVDCKELSEAVSYLLPSREFMNSTCTSEEAGVSACEFIRYVKEDLEKEWSVRLIHDWAWTKNVEFVVKVLELKKGLGATISVFKSNGLRDNTQYDEAKLIFNGFITNITEFKLQQPRKIDDYKLSR